LPAPSPTPPSARRGWLGVVLQPITVPDTIATRAGQSSGPMVVSITAGGPAEQAGLRVGDVLLALNGTSASGPHALRAFLESERIGSTVAVLLLRYDNVTH
jgi:S1-C subfamily serine protease